MKVQHNQKNSIQTSKFTKSVAERKFDLANSMKYFKM